MMCLSFLEVFIVEKIKMLRENSITFEKIDGWSCNLYGDYHNFENLDDPSIAADYLRTYYNYYWNCR